jgi:hypothetical protein
MACLIAPGKAVNIDSAMRMGRTVAHNEGGGRYAGHPAPPEPPGLAATGDEF